MGRRAGAFGRLSHLRQTRKTSAVISTTALNCGRRAAPAGVTLLFLFVGVSGGQEGKKDKQTDNLFHGVLRNAPDCNKVLAQWQADFTERRDTLTRFSPALFFD